VDMAEPTLAVNRSLDSLTFWVVLPLPSASPRS
jgi:hypothetical protein